MNSNLKMSQLGLKILKEFEKCVLTAYDDNGKQEGGVWTIGWGNTQYKNGGKVKQGDTCTQDQADAELAYDLISFENKVKNLITVPLNNAQFDALVDFCYNTGGGYTGSDGKYHRYNIFANINSGMTGQRLYDYWTTLAITQAGVKLPGLVRRRKSEVHLFNTGNAVIF